MKKRMIKQAGKGWVVVAASFGALAIGLFGKGETIAASECWVANTPEQIDIKKGDTEYTLKKGDTLWAISMKINVNVQTLAAINNINLEAREQYHLPVGLVIKFEQGQLTAVKPNGEIQNTGVTVNETNKVVPNKPVGTDVTEEVQQGQGNIMGEPNNVENGQPKPGMNEHVVPKNKKISSIEVVEENSEVELIIPAYELTPAPAPKEEVPLPPFPDDKPEKEAVPEMMVPEKAPQLEEQQPDLNKENEIAPEPEKQNEIIPAPAPKEEVPSTPLPDSKPKKEKMSEESAPDKMPQSEGKQPETSVIPNPEYPKEDKSSESDDEGLTTSEEVVPDKTPQPERKQPETSVIPNPEHPKDDKPSESDNEGLAISEKDIPESSKEETKPEDKSPNMPEHFEPRLTGKEASNAKGAALDGATIVLKPLDQYGRAVGAHMILNDKHEPGRNGKKRNGRINVDPKGWKNFNIDNKWVNNRGHLLGYQFSGLNDELRNLVTMSAYLNKGKEGNGTNQNNPEGMLFYEQRLDSWLRLHPNYKLDYFVKPLYHDDNLTPYAVYMQWVGVDDKDQLFEVKIDGNSKNIYELYHAVTLQNTSPSYNIDYKTGEVTLKEKN
ncbi:DNA/RNA non-specific endonuclease [Atopobacter phocae]|uniref:DNA/RNA non-specific endonuclease n=1 Tax=Atopobacter phocae TaxID=136492 RepID=UPI00047099EE|nr:DNA/RNA non-specific endonuclease [Atopobacter phocae]